MANILGVITAIVLAFSVFVAFKNNGRFKAEVEERDAQSASLEQSQKLLKERNDAFDNLPIQIAALDKQAVAKSEDESALKMLNEELTAEIEEKTEKVASNELKLTQFRQNVEKVDDIDGLVAKMKDLRVTLADLDQQISNDEASIANQSSKIASKEQEVAKRKADIERLGKGESLPSMKTRISAIYSSWGFVTLTDGDNVGVVNASRLNVVRNNQVIAQLLVTAVETRSASASIAPDSMAENITLRVGDTVLPAAEVVAKVDAN